MLIQDTPCRVCHKKLGPEVFLGPVCGKCVRKLHAVVVGKCKARKARK